MAYDSECAKLATHFLAADAIDRTRKSLAQHIQDAVEEWFHEREWELEFILNITSESQGRQP